MTSSMMNDIARESVTMIRVGIMTEANINVVKTLEENLTKINKMRII